MRKFLFGFSISMLTLAATAQEMHVKQYNFTSFSQDQKMVTPVLDAKSSAAAKQHPEYGILPYNAHCKECVELIDERTIDSRLFINPNDSGHTYSQKSFFPLHYKKSENDIWRTIDPRLQPDAANPGVYIATDQPVPTKCDLNANITSLTTDDLEFVFNKGLSLYYFDDSVAYTATEKGNYKYRTVGEEGLLVEDMWDGINMRQIFSAGQVETEYVINAPLQLPISKGWMVIEDHFSLPEGFTVEESAGGEHSPLGYYKGDYVIKNIKGQELFMIQKPIYVDATAYGMHGNYKLLKSGNDYTLQMFIPVSWLGKKDNVYPLYIDPVILGQSQLGNYQHLNGSGPGASMGFSTMPMTCNYQLPIHVPGASQLTNAYVGLEYELTYNNQCGSPPEPAPYCTFSQVTMDVVCDTCGTSTGKLSCNPAQPPYTGTCTTDSDLVHGAGIILINNFVPNYLSCLPPQCPDYNLTFTLKNQDSTCGDVCGYLCANGTMWEMIIEAQTITGFITQNISHQCVGQPVTFTAHASDGVPPYHYVWYNGNSVDTIYDTPTYTVTPPAGITTVTCIIYDTCNVYFASAGPLYDTVGAPPVIDLNWTDTSLCQGIGGKVQLGGSPTATNATSVLWSGSPVTAQGWLSSRTSMNPIVTVPAGTIGESIFPLAATNAYCTIDTEVYVFSDTAPKPVIAANGPTTFCQGQSVTLAVVNPNDSLYLWNNNGGTADSTAANQSASYNVTVTDQNNCTGVSNSITVTILPTPLDSAGGPFNVCQGGTITLGGNPTSIPGANVVWTASNPPAGPLSSTTAFNPTVTIPPTTAGQFYYVATVTDAADGNCAATDTAYVSAFLNPVPVIDSSGPTSFCAGGSVVLSVAGNYTSYLWDNSAGTAFQINVSQSGQYDVTVTDHNGCTGVSNTINVITTAVPPFQVFPDTTIEFGDSVMLSTNAVLSSVSIDSFTWYPNITISCLTCDNPVVTPATNQVYGLIIYANGCSVSDSALILILYPDNFFIPNAFTPNGDGLNDNFYIATQAGVQVLAFQVFDRWGEKVHDGEYPWDGTYKGKPCLPGVYTYLFKLELFGNQVPIARKGSVTLIR